MNGLEPMTTPKPAVWKIAILLFHSDNDLPAVKRIGLFDLSGGASCAVPVRESENPGEKWEASGCYFVIICTTCWRRAAQIMLAVRVAGGFL